MTATEGQVSMESVAAVFEVVAWVGLVPAVVFGTIALALRLSRGPWDSAPAVHVDGEVRWMDARGDFHTDQSPHGDTGDDESVIYYRTRRPDTWYPEPVAHDERAWRIISGCLVAVTVIAIVVSAVAQLA